MLAFLEQYDGAALTAENHRHQRAGKSGADYGDIVSSAQFTAPHARQSTGGGIVWRRFISRKRPWRAG